MSTDYFMDWLLSYIAENVTHAHWILFSLLMLAGLNFPFSEDLILILGGVLASTLGGMEALRLFLFVFLGAYLSDGLAYWIGRLAGDHLWRFRWLRRTFRPRRLKKIESYYARYGMRTLLFGRFIPFGVRNCLFMAAGMGKMSFPRFMIADGIACLFSNSFLFWVSYIFGRNYQVFLNYIEWVELVLFLGFLLVVGMIIWHKWYSPRKRLLPSRVSSCKEAAVLEGQGWSHEGGQKR